MASDPSSVAARIDWGSRTRRLWFLGLAPLLLVVALVVFFLRFGPLGIFQAAFPPVEQLTVNRVALSPGSLTISVTNGGPSQVTVAQVLVDDAYWAHTMIPWHTIPRLSSATVTVPYPWVEGETHKITLITSTGLTFTHTVEVAAQSPRPNALFFWTFSLLGIYVGVIPVFLGVLWFPFLRALERRWLHFFLSFTVGLLVFLGIDAITEALKSAQALPGAFQGTALVTAGVVTSILALLAVGRMASDRQPTSILLLTAYMIAVGIGLHNLGEGLAIGAAYNLGKVSLGTFLVIGFMLHNTTEGLGIVAPIAHEPTSYRHLIALGAVAGVPTILGVWLGGFTYWPVLTTLFLAVGAGAIFQVVYQVHKLMATAAGTEKSFATLHSLGGFVLGLLVMYVTGLIVAF
jgi:zinc transporter, ZIP family